LELNPFWYFSAIERFNPGCLQPAYSQQVIPGDALGCSFPDVGKNYVKLLKRQMRKSVTVIVDKLSFRHDTKDGFSHFDPGKRRPCTKKPELV
jgi:hypothetical protein